MLRLIVISFLLLCNGYTIFGQSQWFIGIEHQSGFIIPHAEEIKSISDSEPWSFAIEASKVNINEKSWSYCKCYPKLGVTARYINFDQPDTLGHGMALNFFVEPQFNPAARLFFSFRPEIGLIYLNRVYDPETNPLNQFYSTPISFWISLSAAVHYNLSDRSVLSFTANYNHISNGGTRDPNKGINFPTLGLKYQYALQKTEYPNFQKSSLPIPDPWWQLSIAGSLQKGTADRSYALAGIHIMYVKPLNAKSLLTLGAEYIADFSLRESTEHRVEGEAIDRAALLVGHNLLIGKFNFHFELGGYLYSPIKAKDPVYQRFSFGYAITERVVAGFSLKAHRHVADYVDLRVGFKL